MSTLPGNQLRTSRILNPSSGNGIVVAIDHGLFIGPLPGIEDSSKTIDVLLPGQPDAIQMTPGTTRANLHKFYGKNKPGVTALREIAAGKIGIEMLKKVPL